MNGAPSTQPPALGPFPGVVKLKFIPKSGRILQKGQQVGFRFAEIAGWQVGGFVRRHDVQSRVISVAMVR
jgi:hypothetical protein